MPVGTEPGSPQLVGEVAREGPVGHVDDEDVDRRAGAGKTPSASQASRIRSTPSAEPDAGGRRPAEVLDEAIVAAAATDGVLGVVEGVGCELEGRARVVVEATHERGSTSKSIPRVESRSHRAKWSADSSERWSTIGGASAMTARSHAVWSRARAGGSSPPSPDLLGELALVGEEVALSTAR